MKILMLSWEYTPHVVGGLGKHVVDLVPQLVANGVEVHLVVPRLGAGEWDELLLLPDGTPATNGSRVYRIDVGTHFGDFYTNTWHNNVHIESFCSHLITQEGGFDLIHDHDWLTGMAAMATKNNFHLPLISTIHATEMGRHHGHLWAEMQRQIHQTEWWLTYESWRVIACSYSMSLEVQNYFGVPGDKIDVIPNGVDPRPFDALNGVDLSSFRLNYAQPYESIVYYVGRIVPEKGLSVLIDAVPLVLREWPGVKFVVAGGGGYVHDLRAKAHAVGVADNIIFPGRISDEARDALFKVANCAVFPSLYEPFGIVALEAMAAGTPVVVSDTGGLSEVVELHETGIKVWPNDPGSLAWGILYTLQHPDWSRRRAANADRVARTLYNWPRVAGMTIDVYNRVVNEAKQADWAFNPSCIFWEGIMLLSDRRIMDEMAKGNIVIEPFEPKQLGTNSYDVRLGPYFYIPNHNMVSVNFTDEADAQSYWLGPHYADEGYIRIRPGDTILAHTEEVVGGRNGFTTSMRARSSIGRSCLSVCKCAGVGDVGYISRWTMEITNHSHAMAVLPVGLRVAQILFDEVGATLNEYAGKYGSWHEWSPRDMLPKLYRDYDLAAVGKERVAKRNGRETGKLAR